MLGHDVRHTGLSQYSTINNSGIEKWRSKIECGDIEQSSAIVDKDGTIYFGAMNYIFYSYYPNGTMKWSYRTGGLIWSSPALGDDGTIYFTSWDAKLYALYPNGTLKWRFGTGDTIHSSPAIAKDGTIYFGGENKNIYAINQNGTEKWHYPTGDFINSGPAIGDDGTVYIGSSDNYLYALYPDGTLRWRFKTGDWIKGNPSIADDGTIYVPSFDGYLYAVYSNGTMKWKATTGSSVAGAGVALAEDGTIYVGTELLRAYFPNGTLKWSTNVNGSIYGTVPAISADGTIFISAGLSLVAVNPDGIIKWQHQIADTNAYSSPCIDANGTVYVGSTWGGLMPYGYLHAFGRGPLNIDANGPYSGPTNISIQFTTTVFGGIPPFIYHWDFGDGTTSNQQNPTHNYTHAGNYTATFTVTDSENNQSSDIASVNIYYPPPTISLLKPKNGIYIANIRFIPFIYPVILGKLTIQAIAEQKPLGVDRVEFYIDSSLQSTDSTPPYTWLWTTKYHQWYCFHKITIVAYDTSQHSSRTELWVMKLL
jgi:large repetitive protein